MLELSSSEECPECSIRQDLHILPPMQTRRLNHRAAVNHRRLEVSRERRKFNLTRCIRQIGYAEGRLVYIPFAVKALVAFSMYGHEQRFNAVAPR